MRAAKIKKIVSLVFTAGLFFTLIMSDWFALMEYRVQDAVFQEPGLPHGDIVIFGIDEDTLAELGRWPWSRGVLAEAIDILNSDPDFRPAVIGLDILLSEPSSFDPDGDAALAEAVRRADNVVTASTLVVGIDRSSLSLEPTFLAHVQPLEELLPYVSAGLTNAITDDDGFVRNAMLWERFRGEKLYSFPVEIALKYLGEDEPDPFIRENAYMFIRYTGLPETEGNTGDFFERSFADIFDDDFDPTWYDGQIVLIGPYALGMMDHYLVPVYPGSHMHGVEVHANVVQAILDGAYKLRVSELTAGLLIAFFIVFAMLVGELLDIRAVIVIFSVIAVGYFFFARMAFYRWYYVLPVLAPLLALGLSFVYHLVYGYVLQAIEKNRLRNTFKKYVDPKLVEVLVEKGEGDSNAVGKKKNIAVLFVDVRGFTPMTERLRDTPEKIVETLNEYLELTSTAVFNNGGSIDKFIGDATMALFNGFVPLDDYVYKAVKAAWDIVQGGAAVNESIKAKYGIEIGFGVGVHCGEAIVGNLGPSFRKDYTAIGDPVNTAARLESNAKHSQVLISRDVYDLVKDRVSAQSIGEIPLKGKSVPLEIFALTDVGG